jgi:hypothetical protein
MILNSLSVARCTRARPFPEAPANVLNAPGAGDCFPEKIDYFGFVLPKSKDIQLTVVDYILATTSNPREPDLSRYSPRWPDRFAASKARIANLRRDNARRS